MKQWFRDEIARYARAHGLDPKVVEAIVEVESSERASAYRYEPSFFRTVLARNPEYAEQNPERVSASYGLMQVMYSTARQHGFVGEPELLFLPANSLNFGCKHLRWLLDRCNGDVEMALAQYNGGSWKNTARPLRNQYYADKVMRHVHALTVELSNDPQAQ